MLFYDRRLRCCGANARLGWFYEWSWYAFFLSNQLDIAISSFACLSIFLSHITQRKKLRSTVAVARLQLIHSMVVALAKDFELRVVHILQGTTVYLHDCTRRLCILCVHVPLSYFGGRNSNKITHIVCGFSTVIEYVNIVLSTNELLGYCL